MDGWTDAIEMYAQCDIELSANRRRSVRFGRVSAAAPGSRRFRRPGAKQIAAELGLSLVTVKVHRGQVMRKMLAKSVAELVRMADRLGLPGAA